jgi:hypothetical protein
MGRANSSSMKTLPTTYTHPTDLDTTTRLTLGLATKSHNNYILDRTYGWISLEKDAAWSILWLRYYFWYSLVEHLHPVKRLVVCLDEIGYINSHGSRVRAQLQMVENGFVVYCS